MLESLLPIVTDNIPIDKVVDTPFMSVAIEKHLVWHKDMTQIKNEIDNQCGILYLTQDVLNKEADLIIYNLFIRANLIYYQTMWGFASSTALDISNVMQ